MNSYAPRVAAVNRSLAPREPAVALTFDDGPDVTFTPAVLDILSARGIRATFFVVGKRAEENPDIVQRIVAEGHALGSHTASHPDLWELSLPAAIAEFRRGRRMLEAITGQPVRLFRPPKGWMNLEQAAGLRAFGFRTWLWNVDPEDWAPGATSESVLHGVGQLQSGDVVLLHDAIELPIDPSTANRGATVAALPAIIDRVQAQGFDLVTLS
jgi:peptidoglycan/xylan/chitin deacetylase (PgdA/CDA1 family)